MIGKEILNYRITGIIGQGGMGTVYLGVNKFIQEQKVAIKVINHDMLNDFTRQRLEEEAHRLASLNHPNIVHLVNFHKDEKGSVYLIMEYAEGVSIEKYLREVNGLVVEERICSLFEPILDGIGCAHKHKNSKGENDPIIHCDIKPANIVITPDKEPKIKILDFGIAQILSEQDEQARLVMGTPSYMSPEQVRGEHLDARSDIYSLGVLLHQMLTGNAPYDTTTLTEQQINQKVVEEPLPRMATYYKYVSDKVQKIVDKATAKNPDDRYQTCEEFKKALHRAIYPWKPALWMKIAAAAVIALVLGTCWYVWDYNRIKVLYYKDYVEVWGVPKGIHKISSSSQKHTNNCFKFVEQKRRVLRVTHVNSKGNPVEYEAVKDNNKPIDQEITYNESGNVNRIKVKDRSGKVLYVKQYNDKLNVVTFHFDDEHNTPKVLTNLVETLDKYGRDDNFENKGRIACWWIDYDENGFMERVRYRSLDNEPAADEQGIYGRSYVRDEVGREKEIHFIGIDDAPSSTRWGLGITKWQYDEDDNWCHGYYLTVDGKPTVDTEGGISECKRTFDEYGNVLDWYYLDGYGKPMFSKSQKFAGTKHEYNKDGTIRRISLLDIEANPMFVSGRGYGFAMIDQEFDDNGYRTKISFLDPQGKPTETTEGNASRTFVNDAHGNAIEIWNYDINNRLCLNTDGYAGVKCEYDSLGNQTKIIYYGKDQKPCETKSGTVGELYEYDERQLIKSVSFLGKNLKPALNNNNISIIKYDYDKRGNNTRMTFYEPDGKTLRLSREGTAGWKDSYDDNGNHLERQFFDTDGNPHMPSGIHYAKVKYTYDENGNLKSMKYYNLQDNLTSVVDGIAGYEYICDRRGNILEEKPIGTNGDLTNGKLISKKKYDKFANVTENSLYDKNGAALNNQNVHRYEYVYNSRNQLIEERHYGKDGNLVMSIPDNWAVQKNEFDNKGYRIKTFFYGTDNNPCNCDEGWSSATYEYDVFGNIIRQCFFGVDGKPTDPKDMVPVGIAKYDKWGNLVYVAGQDGKENFIVNPNTGWAIARYEFNNHNNRISESYFDASDKPSKGKEGYHKALYKYDNLDRQIEISYFGENGEAISYLGFHKQKITYEENTNNVREIACFDKNDKATNCDAGFHKRVTTYDSLSVATNRKYYAANGELISNQVWNGEDWVVVRNWQDDAKQLARELPLTIGPLTITSLRITGSNSCDLIMKMEYSRIEMDESDFENMKKAVKELTKKIEEILNRKPYVTGKLYDKDNNLVYEVKT